MRLQAAFDPMMILELAGGFDRASHAALVRTNWIRTLAWTARGMLVFGWLWWTLHSALS